MRSDIFILSNLDHARGRSAVDVVGWQYLTTTERNTPGVCPKLSKED